MKKENAAILAAALVLLAILAVVLAGETADRRLAGDIDFDFEGVVRAVLQDEDGRAQALVIDTADGARSVWITDARVVTLKGKLGKHKLAGGMRVFVALSGEQPETAAVVLVDAAQAGTPG